MAVLAGKPAARRSDRAPVAGKSILDRLEPSRPQANRHEISHDPQAIEALSVTLFLEAHRMVHKQITLDLDAIDDPSHGDREGKSFHGCYGGYRYPPP